MGSLEEAKGKAKEAAGDVTDNPDLKREGAAQSEKGEAEAQAREAEAEAQERAGTASAKDREEKAVQEGK